MIIGFSYNVRLRNLAYYMSTSSSQCFVNRESLNLDPWTENRQKSRQIFSISFSAAFSSFFLYSLFTGATEFSILYIKMLVSTIILICKTRAKSRTRLMTPNGKKPMQTFFFLFYCIVLVFFSPCSSFLLSFLSFFIWKVACAFLVVFLFTSSLLFFCFFHLPLSFSRAAS